MPLEESGKAGRRLSRESGDLPHQANLINEGAKFINDERTFRWDEFLRISKRLFFYQQGHNPKY